MYSYMPYFLYIAAMLWCSEDEEFFDVDFYVCGPSVICLWRGACFDCLDLLVL
jgi:hypothetical protein